MLRLLSWSSVARTCRGTHVAAGSVSRSTLRFGARLQSTTTTKSDHEPFVEVTDEDFKQQVLDEPQKVVLVDFYAE
jgi:thiol:disulfide interchange protein